MWMEFLQIFVRGNPMQKVADDFKEMYQTAHQMAKLVEPHIFDHTLPIDQRSHIYKLDVRVNKLERSIRKGVVAHLSLGRSDVPYGLLMMSLVKDVERIGDYVKNISEVAQLGGSQVPEGDIRTELAELVQNAMILFEQTPDILTSQDRDQAHELVQMGRTSGKRCDKLLVALAKSDFDAGQTTATVLLTRFYKRLGGHLVNILSSVIMPLHKVDFYDERVADIHGDGV